ncbi:MAG: restriction endonuclease [Caulobacteraceae bacterium]|nr:restriction endonuclease [Caulobacteraceae bacterium]
MPRTQSEEGAKFVRYFGPLLDALRKLGGSGTPEEVAERIAHDEDVSDEERNELLPSGEPRYRNQVHWARFYLVKEGLVDASKRGVWSLSERGQTIRLSPDQARAIFLKWVRIFQDQRRAKATPAEPNLVQIPAQTPGSIGTYRGDVIDLMLSIPPAGFERLAQRLLREAGFVQVVVTGSSSDGGIDGHGTLRINPLVSFKVLFQCKRYAGSVTPSQVRDFRGAMAGRADKGIIITTGAFTTEATREASRDGVPPIELIDGPRLVEMLERLGLGLKAVTTFEIDDAFFNEFRNKLE